MYTVGEPEAIIYGELPVGWAVLYLTMLQKILSSSMRQGGKVEKFPVSRYCESYLDQLHHLQSSRNCKIQQYEHLRISGDSIVFILVYKNESKGIEKLRPWLDTIQQRCRIKSKS